MAAKGGLWPAKVAAQSGGVSNRHDFSGCIEQSTYVSYRRLEEYAASYRSFAFSNYPPPRETRLLVFSILPVEPNYGCMRCMEPIPVKFKTLLRCELPLPSPCALGYEPFSGPAPRSARPHLASPGQRIDRSLGSRPLAQSDRHFDASSVRMGTSILSS